jgi:Family of unknown function (DUF6527)
LKKDFIMGLLSPILRSATDNHLLWWCPGCECAHQITYGEGEGPRWGWNGDTHKPTFSPSVLVKGRDFTAAGRAAYEAWYTAGCPTLAPGKFESQDTCCHSFVVNGQMQFLTDCTHSLAGQTVDIPPWDHPD